MGGSRALPRAAKHQRRPPVESCGALPGAKRYNSLSEQFRGSEPDLVRALGALRARRLHAAFQGNWDVAADLAIATDIGVDATKRTKVRASPFLAHAK